MERYTKAYALLDQRSRLSESVRSTGELVIAAPVTAMLGVLDSVREASSRCPSAQSLRKAFDTLHKCSSYRHMPQSDDTTAEADSKASDRHATQPDVSDSVSLAKAIRTALKAKGLSVSGSKETIWQRLKDAQT